MARSRQTWPELGRVVGIDSKAGVHRWTVVLGAGAGVGVMVGAVVSTDAEAVLTSAMLETPISVAKDTTTVSSVPAEMAVAISAVTLLNTSSSCYTRHKDRKKGRKRGFSAN